MLVEHGQEHVLGFWDELTPTERDALAEEIRQIDFPLLAVLHAGEHTAMSLKALANRAGPPPAFRLAAPQKNPFSVDEAKQRAAEALRAGQVGVILVAGGQGSRLGFEHPKGMYPIGPVSGNSLFQIHLEKILAASRRYGAAVPLCLMTSPATHDETIAFLDQHDRFGLPESDVTVFCQGTMPAVDAASGKLLLAEPGHLALSPDGHGGTLAALVRSGSLDALVERGIRYLFYLQVDNPLVDICGLEFLGYHLLSRSEMSTQVVAKQSPSDRVGNIVAVDGRLHVIEYSDADKEEAVKELLERRGPDGELEIWAGSIAVHVMDVAFLDRMAHTADALPFHLAKKKVSHLDRQGNLIDPSEPNAIKFERFIFDLLPEAQNAIVVEVDPARHFAPLKNAPGSAQDSPEAVQAQLIAEHTSWLRTAGVEIAEGVPVEISPLFALWADDLPAKIPPGTRVTEARFFC
ncbi:MAG: UTP--glucose-1-phosphate uridylyltransferase [Pirellulales bacterium]|nr:UTP--glucose-1-phosphate uridylyltransferase [Pirellulales bacterium]